MGGHRGADRDRAVLPAAAGAAVHVGNKLLLHPAMPPPPLPMWTSLSRKWNHRDQDTAPLLDNVPDSAYLALHALCAVRAMRMPWMMGSPATAVLGWGCAVRDCVVCVTRCDRVEPGLKDAHTPRYGTYYLCYCACITWLRWSSKTVRFSAGLTRNWISYRRGRASSPPKPYARKQRSTDMP